MGRIDTSYDFRTDAGGKDPDLFSATLRRYHRKLWSKPLPSGAMFDLVDTTPRYPGLVREWRVAWFRMGAFKACYPLPGLGSAAARITDRPFGTLLRPL